MATLRFASLSSCQLQALVHSLDDQMRVGKEVRCAVVRIQGTASLPAEERSCLDQIMTGAW